MPTKVLADAIIDLEGKEQYIDLVPDASQFYKEANSQSSAPLDVSSSLSALEESLSSLAEGEGGNSNSSSAMEALSSQSQPVKTTAIVHVYNPTQVSSPAHQKETVIQMDTDEAQGASSSTGKGMGCDVNVRSENPELQAEESIKSRGEVRGGQSQTGGVHSVLKTTLLATRTSTITASSAQASAPQDSTLERLSHSQFYDLQSSRSSSRTSSSATRDVDLSQSTRATFIGDSQDTSFNLL